MAAIDFTDTYTWTIRHQPDLRSSALFGSAPAVLAGICGYAAVSGMMHRIELAAPIVSVLAVVAFLLALLTIRLFIPLKIRADQVSEATRVAAADAVSDYRRISAHLDARGRRQAGLLLRARIGALADRDNLSDMLTAGGKLRSIGSKLVESADEKVAFTRDDWEGYVADANTALQAALEQVQATLTDTLASQYRLAPAHNNL